MVAATLLIALAGCVHRATPAPAWQGAAYAPRADGVRLAASSAALAALGRAMFFDVSLSASGRTSCASCHDPAFAYAPPNALPLQLGGADGRTLGTRAAPTLRYLQTLPAYADHHHDNDGDDSIDAGPTGGHMWDGRAPTAHDQARLPLLSPAEMANATPQAVVQRIARSVYAADFRRVFGELVFDDVGAAFDAALMALEVFQQSPRDFYPYSSRYDEFLRGRATLTAQEQRGLDAFTDPVKGNCASCHPSAPGNDGAFPLFTDFGHVALGVPHHGPLPPGSDLGLCGPLRTDLADRPETCGRFRTPTLRNVAVRQRYFHNGSFSSLREVLRFYVLRDSEPERFYPRGRDGSVQRYDDLPARHHGNVETGAPFTQPGTPRALSDADIDDIVAFLHTLTDADVAAARGLRGLP